MVRPRADYHPDDYVCTQLGTTTIKFFWRRSRRWSCWRFVSSTIEIGLQKERGRCAIHTPLWLILLHELGHVVHGHGDRFQVNVTNTFREELEAWEYADATLGRIPERLRGIVGRCLTSYLKIAAPVSDALIKRMDRLVEV